MIFMMLNKRQILRIPKRTKKTLGKSDKIYYLEFVTPYVHNNRGKCLEN